MGYEEGKGLGSKGQGRVKPVEAKLRKGKGAVGMYGNEGISESKKDLDEDFSEERQATVEGKKIKHVPQWRKQGVSAAISIIK